MALASLNSFEAMGFSLDFNQFFNVTVSDIISYLLRKLILFVLWCRRYDNQRWVELIDSDQKFG